MREADDGPTTERPLLLYGKIFYHRAGTGLYSSFPIGIEVDHFCAVL